jgi:hypothetical protein
MARVKECKPPSFAKQDSSMSHTCYHHLLSLNIFIIYNYNQLYIRIITYIYIYSNSRIDRQGSYSVAERSFFLVDFSDIMLLSPLDPCQTIGGQCSPPIASHVAAGSDLLFQSGPLVRQHVHVACCIYIYRPAGTSLFYHC